MSKKQIKNDHLRLRLTADEKTRIEKLAAKEGLPVSQYLRRVLKLAGVFVLLFLAGCGGSPLSTPSTTNPQQTVQVTESIDPLEGINPVTVPVPAGALDVSVWRNSETIVALQILMLDGGGVPIYDVELSAGVLMTEPVPLADDVHSIMVTKEDGPETRVRLIFDVR